MRVPTDKMRIIAEAIFNAKLRYGIAVYYKPRLKVEDDKCTVQEPLQVLQNDMLRELFGHKRADKINMEKLRKCRSKNIQRKVAEEVKVLNLPNTGQFRAWETQCSRT